MSILTLPALKENFDRFMEFVDDESRKIGFKKSKLYNINLAAEEAIINVINYAYKEMEDGTVTVDCSPLNNGTDGIMITVTDDGNSFNPLEKATPDTKAEVHEREIGGLGIHMIKKCCTKVHYSGENSQNKLTMTFHLPSDSKE